MNDESKSTVIASPTERANISIRLRDCLIRQGLEGVEIGIDGTISFDDAGLDPAELRRRTEACAPSGTPPELTERDYRALYENAQQQIDCLDKEGYRVAGLPTYETFRDRWKAGAPFFPHGVVAESYPSIGAGELERLRSVCPQF